MKKTRNFAALLAAVMCVSDMGAMSAFAEDMVALGESTDAEKTGSVGLKFHNTPATEPAGTKTATWYITVDTAELTWEVTESISASTLVWNGTDYTSNGDGIMTRTFDESKNENTSVTSDEAKFDKTATITNKCNFDLTAITQTLTDEGGTNNLFSLVNDGATNVGRGGTFAVTVRPNVANINTYLADNKTSMFSSVDTVNVGSVSLTFTGDTANLYGE